MLGCHRLCTGGRLQWWPAQSHPASAICCHLGVRTPKVKEKSEITLQPKARKLFLEGTRGTAV